MDEAGPLSHQTLADIISRASSLYERLQFPLEGVEVDSAKEIPLIDERLRRWLQSAARGDQAKFIRRIGWLDHNSVSIRPFLTSTPQLQQEELFIPSWAILLQESLGWFLAQSKDFSALRDYPFLAAEGEAEDEEVFPFEEVLAPFVDYASQKLIKWPQNPRSHSRSDYLSLLTPAAFRQLQRYLLRVLSGEAAKTFFLEFSVFKVNYGASHFLASQTKTLQKPPLTANSRIKVNPLYQFFCQGLLNGKILDLFTEYSRLGRRLATYMDFWIEETTSLLARLANDRAEIAATFNGGTMPGLVKKIEAGLSDRHNSGRTVIIVTFETGLKLVYKQRSLSPEVSFAKIVGWCNRQGRNVPGYLPLKTLLVLNRQNYGWMEFVEPKPCQALEEVKRFFWRAGEILALVYSFNGSDCSAENLMANGEHPFLIDLETLFSPETADFTTIIPAGLEGLDDAAPTENQEAKSVLLKSNSPAYSFPANSVLDCGLLPRRVFGPDDKSFDPSGFGGNGTQTTTFMTTAWAAINTDLMAPVRKPLDFRYNRNLPNFKGQQITSGGYVREIVEGFRQQYSLLLAKRESLLGKGGPLTQVRGVQIRYLVRNTRTYSLLLNRTSRAEFQREGIESSIAWDGLSRAFLYNREKPSALPIVESEHASLTQDDIPYFFTYTNSTSLFTSNGPVVEGFFYRCGYDSLITKVKNLSKRDLQFQISLIENTFLHNNLNPTY